uniref:Uncharacterized protein n=1 Tax=viral metagenome TaxID=1070528 RepID=A0A6H1ZDT3_9ZZZZ
MPIRRGSHAFRRQFELAGVIRLGGEQSRGEWNQELSYFRLTSEDVSVDAAEKLVKVYGEKPTTLHVTFPSNDPDEVFEDQYELWRGSKNKDVKGVLMCCGDGIHAKRIIDEENPWNREKVECPCPENCAFAMEHTSDKLRKDGHSACSAMGRLRVVCYRVSVLDIYEIRTGSINAFQGIRNKLLDILESPIFGGRLRGLPLLLKRVPKKTRFGKVIYPVRIEIPAWEDWKKEAQFLMGVRDKILDATGMQAIPAPPDPRSMPTDLVAHTHQLPVSEPEIVPEPTPEMEPPVDDPYNATDLDEEILGPPYRIPPSEPPPEKPVVTYKAPTAQSQGEGVARMAREKREQSANQPEQPDYTNWFK